MYRHDWCFFSFCFIRLLLCVSVNLGGEIEKQSCIELNQITVKLKCKCCCVNNLNLLPLRRAPWGAFSGSLANWEISLIYLITFREVSSRAGGNVWLVQILHFVFLIGTKPRLYRMNFELKIIPEWEKWAFSMKDIHRCN